MRRRGLRRLVALAALLALTLSPIVGSASRALASPASCDAGMLHLVLAASPSTTGDAPVTITLRATNVAARSCGLVLGGTSPAYHVLDATGASVWSGCGGPASACATYLELRVLAPGASVLGVARWDGRLRSGADAPAGVYRATARISGIDAIAIASFRLAASPSAPAIVLSDSGTTRRLVPGARLAMRLTGPSLYRWSSPRSSSPAVVAVLDAVGGETATATLVARAVGVASVSATGTPTCSPACLLPSRLFRVRVIVVAAPVPSSG